MTVNGKQTKEKLKKKGLGGWGAGSIAHHEVVVSLWVFRSEI